MLELTHEERLRLAQMMMELLDHWGVPPRHRLVLLGLEGAPVRTVKRLGESTPLPQDPEVMERVGHLLGIADALRTMFPRNVYMGARWLSRPNRRFQQRPPLAVMVEEGLSGLIAVRSDLDCAYAWEHSQAS